MNLENQKIDSRKSFISNPKTSMGIMLLSILVFVFNFLIAVIRIDIYKIPIVGEMYELLWLPMLLLVVVIPIISILILIKPYTKKNLL